MNDDEPSGCLNAFLFFGGLISSGVIGYHHGNGTPLPSNMSPWTPLGSAFFYSALNSDHTMKKAVEAGAIILSLEVIAYGLGCGVGYLTK